jgi:hypothetical protein
MTLFLVHVCAGCGGGGGGDGGKGGALSGGGGRGGAGNCEFHFSRRTERDMHTESYFSCLNLNIIQIKLHNSVDISYIYLSFLL